MEQQRYQIGFEFQRQPDGRLTGRQWFAALHLFASDIGEVATTEGHLRNAGLALDLAFSGDSLVGTLGQAHALVLKRSAPLLAPPPPPTYPAAPSTVWVYRSEHGFWATPVADAELVVIGDEGGRLHAVRLRDGSPAWQVDTGAPIHGAALLAPETVTVLNDAGRLVQLDRATGRERWSQTIGGGAVARHLPAATEFSYDFAGPQPALADATLYVPTADGTVVAIDSATGTLRWRAEIGGLLRQSVLVAGPCLVVASWSGRIAALSRADGAVVWTLETGAPATADPVRYGDQVLVSSRNSKLYSLALADGSVRWTRFHAGSWVESAPRVVGDELFIGPSDLRTVTCLDAATGRERWTTDVLGWSWGTPAVAGETVYAGAAGAIGYPIAQDGGLIALDRRDGSPKWRQPLPADSRHYVTGIAGSPTVTAGLVLFADRAGTLHALPTTSPQ